MRQHCPNLQNTILEQNKCRRIKVRQRLPLRQSWGIIFKTRESLNPHMRRRWMLNLLSLKGADRGQIHTTDQCRWLRTDKQGRWSQSCHRPMRSKRRCTTSYSKSLIWIRMRPWPTIAQNKETASITSKMGKLGALDRKIKKSRSSPTIQDQGLPLQKSTWAAMAGSSCRRRLRISVRIMVRIDKMTSEAIICPSQPTRRVRTWK